LTFRPNIFEDAGEYVDYPEFTARKIKAAVITNKNAVGFQKVLSAKATSDDEDSDTSSLIATFQDIDMPDPEIIKIVLFYKACHNCFLLTLGFSIVSQGIKNYNIHVQQKWQRGQINID